MKKKTSKKEKTTLPVLHVNKDVILEDNDLAALGLPDMEKPFEVKLIGQ